MTPPPGKRFFKPPENMKQSSDVEIELFAQSIIEYLYEEDEEKGGALN